MQIRLMLIGLILLALSACNQITPTPAPAWTPTRAQTTPTLSATATPFPLPTRAPMNSATPARTATVPPTPIRSATIIPPTVASDGWDTHTLLVGPGNPGRLYALQGDRGAPFFESPKRRLLMSDDMGDTWKSFAGGLPVQPSCLANVNLDYATRDALYASTCQGLFRWVDGTWSLVSSQETIQVAIVYGQPNILWAITPSSKGGPVLRSDDGGKTWKNVSDGLIHFNGLATLAVDPRDAKTIYGIIMPKYGGSYLRRMFVGNQWHTMPTPLNNSQIDIGMTIDGASGDLYVTMFALDGWQLWHTGNPTVSNENAVVWEKVSTFERDLWATVLASGSSPQGLMLFVKLAPGNCNTQDARCDPLIQRSLDGGKTWNRLVIR